VPAVVVLVVRVAVLVLLGEVEPDVGPHQRPGHEQPSRLRLAEERRGERRPDEWDLATPPAATTSASLGRSARRSGASAVPLPRRHSRTSAKPSLVPRQRTPASSQGGHRAQQELGRRHASTE
jgi:hypothetical protein